MEKLFDDEICYYCKKPFIIHDRGAYRFKRQVRGTTKYFCKWSCMTAYDKAAAEKESARRKKVGERRREKNRVQQMQKMRKETD